MEQGIETTIDPAGEFFAMQPEEDYAYLQLRVEIKFQKIAQIVLFYGPHKGLTFEMLFIKTRQREICETRQFVTYFARTYIENITFNQIAILFRKEGGNPHYNHATVMHSIQKVKDLSESDRVFRRNFNRINDALKMIK